MEGKGKRAFTGEFLMCFYGLIGERAVFPELFLERFLHFNHERRVKGPLLETKRDFSVVFHAFFGTWVWLKMQDTKKIRGRKTKENRLSFIQWFTFEPEPAFVTFLVTI